MEGSFKDHLYVLILCGGGGTRLWPRSRQKTPKQFLPKFFGEKSIFAQTVDRAKLLTSTDKIFVITNNDYVDEVIQQGNIVPRNIIAEPQAKNTAMAMGVGATYIKKIDPEAVIINFASDHIIDNFEVFCKNVLLAAETAYSGDYLLTVGIKPTFAHTGLGYIESGEEFAVIKGVYKVVSFKEKPDLQTAETFLKSGNYFWNASLYVWSVKSILTAFSRYASEISGLLTQIEANIGTDKEEEVLTSSYETVENIAIDYAISEKADNLLLVPATFFWNDVGDWKVTYDLKTKDDQGNVVEAFGKNGWFLGEDAKNCLVEVENKLVAAVGVSNLVIIQTEDAILICAKDKAQDVKKIVNELKEKEKKEYL